MTSPEDLRTELHRVMGLTSSSQNDRALQELMADVLITISESLVTLAANVYEPDPADTPDDFLPIANQEGDLLAAMTFAGAILGSHGIDPERLAAWIGAELEDDPAQQIHQQPAETPEAQMMDAVRPTEAGQTVVIEGGDGEMGTVTGFGSTEGRDYATVEWEHRGDLSVWVDILLVVALEADHGPDDDQFDLVVEDEAEAEAAAREAEQGDLDDAFAKELARRAKKAKKKGKGA